MDATKRGWLTGFQVKRGWIGDMSNFAYTKRKCVSDFFGELGGSGFRGVCGFVNNVGRVSGIVAGPDVNANAFLVYCGDLKFGVGYESVEGLVPVDEEPGVIDEFEG
jgi:hypothetical protein